MGKFFTTAILLICMYGIHAQVLKGTIYDGKTNEPIIGANVIIKGTTRGTTTDFDGNFQLETKGASFPLTLQVTFIGYQAQDITVSSASSPISVKLAEDTEMLGEVSVVEQRLSAKQRESALTVEAMDALAIKETPAVSFYDGLGNLKGVDLTSASIGFKVINTRGFNSTSPVRSLQIIDGVDNQAPGLNFSLGNFLGASELDIQNVDIIAGASTAFYGPGAFNGVISMTTKNPFDYQGISASVKVGERNLVETAVRYAEAYKVFGKDYENFAFKINLYYLRADDWEADNLDPTDQSEEGIDNPGGYDAINRYGDETRFDDGGDIKTYPGLGNFYRTGIEEKELVDYDTRNLKLGTSLHYRIKKDLELIYAFNFGYGTTVYQGDNRYSLKDIQFYQNRIELSKKDKWFVRAYSTNEDAGNSYDAYFTALQMQNAYVDEGVWGSTYRNYWSFIGSPEVQNLPGYPSTSLPRDEFEKQLNIVLEENASLVQGLHDQTRETVNVTYGPEDALTPGSAAFDSLFTYITERSFSDGGSKFVDRSALYHVQGQYNFDPTKIGDFKIGGNGRLYRPNSEGTIFRDTAGQTISNYEFGAFGGWEKKFGERLKLGLTARVDKNENFDFLSSQAVSMVYNFDNLNTLRVSFSSAIRNPTLQDQYLYYNVGRAILLGNLEGYDSLVTQDDIETFLGADTETRRNYEWGYYSVDPVRPEKVQTAEIGYRTTLWKRLFVDANYYYSWYQDFIGFNVGLDIEDDPGAGPADRLSGAQAYRIAANAEDQVTTQGFSLGLNYYFWDYYMLAGNYTWNVLNTATDDPIIPAFNTPENKYNISFSGRDISVWKFKHLGFNVTYKWIQGFLFEGSPQFTGYIDSYDLLDAQVSYAFPKQGINLKLGSSNLLNNKVFQVYGGPRVGRLTYFSISYELK
ncbi:TonB-dependent receptor [Owenweeksia hongkongensis]|uniref:TonB-dependent receptor n=1 Tax=Owenweeksia hongkongensis TaxID=253245 RepID=UPI003A92A662